MPYIGDVSHRWGAVALIALSVVVMMRTMLSPMWLVGLGAVVGALGWVQGLRRRGARDRTVNSN